MWIAIKRILSLIAIVLVAAYILLLLHAAVNWQEDPKGPPAWMEWQGDGKTIL